MITRRRLIKSAIVVGCLAGNKGFAAPDDKLPGLIEPVPESADSLEDLKKKVTGQGWAKITWREFEFRGKFFLLCDQVYPHINVKDERVHVWRQKKGRPFKLVWSFRTLDVGAFEVILDETKGTISLKGTANNEFKNSILASVMLAAT